MTIETERGERAAADRLFFASISTDNMIERERENERVLPPLPTMRRPLTTIEREREESAAAACNHKRESIFCSHCR
jgi:hypothetical protein